VCVCACVCAHVNAHASEAACVQVPIALMNPIIASHSCGARNDDTAAKWRGERCQGAARASVTMLRALAGREGTRPTMNPG
jgi:hypothetical protein